MSGLWQEQIIEGRMLVICGGARGAEGAVAPLADKRGANGIKCPPPHFAELVE